MDEILHQLGGLFLGTVPTMIVFLLVVASYRILVYGPLTKTLKERRARTEGAIEEAHASVAAAGRKADEYEAQLREARKAVFEAREQRLRQWNEERENALNAARASAQKKITEAKGALDQEVQSARRAIEASAEELAKDVLRVVLPAGDAASDLALSGSGR
ncbi:MAG TPA: ATP synthase F0 subunit B [Acidobacteriaceae bacterium]|jgi:F-type H+-transporting ATPase subunit b|nr:ATP synthase F0 subunit B [Acidobacteriaceae bacterium]